MQETKNGTKTVRFLTGTWYEVTYPADLDIDLEEIYTAYWSYGQKLPEGVFVAEQEVDHIWETYSDW